MILEKDVAEVIDIMNIICKQIDKVNTKIAYLNEYVILEKKFIQTKQRSDYLQKSLLTLLDEYSKNPSTGAQKLCSKIRRILYKLDESGDNREKFRTT